MKKNKTTTKTKQTQKSGMDHKTESVHLYLQLRVLSVYLQLLVCKPKLLEVTFTFMLCNASLDKK